MSSNSINNTSSANNSTSSINTSTISSANTSTSSANPFTTSSANPSTTSSANSVNAPVTTPAEWNENTIRLLINQRKHRNVEYHQIIGRSRVAFWESVARRINRSANTDFDWKQCKRKFQNLVSTYYVSIDNLICKNKCVYHTY